MKLTATTSLASARIAIAERLRGAAVEDADREAMLLILRASGRRALDFHVSPEAPLADAASAVESFARRRVAGEPLSRIEGRREFWSLNLAISPDVLDPRADTETLVEAAVASLRRSLAPTDPLPPRGGGLGWGALSAIPPSGDRPAAPPPLPNPPPLGGRGFPRILDFGTGSGAILCALLTEFPEATGLGVDASEAAAAIARANIEALGLASRAEVHLGDWGAGIDESFDLIVSNPPYIPSADIAGLELAVRAYDPTLALDGGADGLEAYRKLAPEIARLLAPGGRFALEIGIGQAADVSAILDAAGLRVSETRRDLAGEERVLCGSARAPTRPCSVL